MSFKPQSIDPKEYQSRDYLKNKGWTDTLIKEYLGAPDITRHTVINSKNQKGMHYYHIDRIIALEESESFVSHIHKSRTAQANANLDSICFSKKISTANNIKIKILPIDVVYDKACQYYNKHIELSQSIEPPYYPKPISKIWADKTSNINLLNRIAVNYLRHTLSPYEEVLKNKNEWAKYIEVNKKVYEAIAQAYPKLAQECSRQFDIKTGKEVTAE